MARRPGNQLTTVLTALFLPAVVTWTGVTTGWSVTIPVLPGRGGGIRPERDGPPTEGRSPRAVIWRAKGRVSLGSTRPFTMLVG